MLDLLLPWRWKHRVHRFLDAKFNSIRDTLITALNDTRARLEERLREHGAEHRAEISELGDAIINGLREVRAHVDVRLYEQTTHLERLFTKVESDLSELGDGIVHALSELRVHVDVRLYEQTTHLERLFTKLESDLSELGDGIVHALSELRVHVDVRLYEQTTHLERLFTKMESDLSELGDGIVHAMSELRAHVDVRLHEQTTYLKDDKTDLEEDISELGDSLINALNEFRAHARELGAALESRLADRVDSAINEINDIRGMILNVDGATQTRFNTLENAVLPSLGEQVHELAAVQLHAAARKNDRSTWHVHAEERYAPAQAEPFEAYLARAAEQFPSVFTMWRERLEATGAAFEQTKLGNVANVSDVYSWAFRDFFETQANGRVLDVGCGVFGRPFYLQGYPAELISGVEPLPMREPADFELIRGISEYLPWPDAAFSTVISATSLDHCLSLQHSIEEMTRVLRPGGRMLLWINSVPGSPKFEPNRPGFTPSDQYHLFHFDKAWFEPLLEARFEFLDRLELKRHGYADLFYSLVPK